MKKIRVLVVDDSLTIRKKLIEVIQQDQELEVVGEAENGKQAIEICQTERPHVLTMDMMMPVMSGLSATEVIMAYCPTPILIVSASTNRGEMFKTYDALAAGALDVLEKPTGQEIDACWEKEFLARLKILSRIKVITHPKARLLSLGKANESKAVWYHPEIIAIGASTGGPSAIYEILRHLPKDYPIPIALVLHISKPFDVAFAEWLNGLLSIPVRKAESGQKLPRLGEPGVFMAPPDQHLLVQQGKFLLTHGPERFSCRPSVDVLFESLALEMPTKTLACLLTGMGRDGAQGLKNIRDKGGGTIAQDEASCVVFGMPKEAIDIGAAQEILSLERIGSLLQTLKAHAGRTT